MILDSADQNVANFVQKSFEIISNIENSHIVEWLDSGKQFIIKDTELFQSVILPHYFRHRNINSFIRLLNMYGFHKSRKQPTKNSFSHPNFLKGQPNLLVNIKRKPKEDKLDQNITQIKKVKSEELISINLIQKPKQLNPSLPISRQIIRTKQIIEFTLQKQKQLQKTALKPEFLPSLCSIQHIQDIMSEGLLIDCPFRSLIEKSQIMELNPEVYSMKHENITSFHHIDMEFDIKNENQQEIERQRKILNSRMVGYNILQTINFMNQFQF